MHHNKKAKSGFRVLVLDDDMAQRQTLKAILEDEGFEVIGSARARDALNFLKKKDIDVAVVDLRLSDLNEKGVLEKIGIYAEEVPIIINTGYASYDTAKKAINIGVFGYVEKGEDPTELIRQVNRAVQTRLLRRTESLEQAVADRIAELEEANKTLKKNDREKSELLEKLNEAQQIAMIGTWEWNLHTNDVWWSNETYRIFGVTPQDYVPSFEANGRFIHPDDFEKYTQSFEHSFRTGDLLDLDVRLLTNDRRLKYCNAKGKIVYDDSNQPIRFVGTIMDITERKRAEEALAKNRNELQQLTLYMNKLQEEIQLRISREIHDELGQNLTAMKIEIDRWIAMTRAQQHAEEKTIQSFPQRLNECIDMIHHICSDLRPSVLDDFGLDIAVEQLVHKFSVQNAIPCQLTCTPISRDIDEETTINLYRIIQEALTNIACHANATTIEVQLQIKNGDIVLDIVDNGTGYVIENVNRKKSFGILGMRERAVALGGDFILETTPGTGTRINVTVPVKMAEKTI